MICAACKHDYIPSIGNGHSQKVSGNRQWGNLRIHTPHFTSGPPMAVEIRAGKWDNLAAP
jgi:hypothetical protein